MLRLTSEYELKTCPQCKGKGWISCPPTIATRTGVNGFNLIGAIRVPGTGKPIPCPTCKGKKVVEG